MDAAQVCHLWCRGRACWSARGKGGEHMLQQQVVVLCTGKLCRAYLSTHPDWVVGGAAWA